MAENRMGNENAPQDQKKVKRKTRTTVVGEKKKASPARRAKKAGADDLTEKKPAGDGRKVKAGTVDGQQTKKTSAEGQKTRKTTMDGHRVRKTVSDGKKTKKLTTDDRMAKKTAAAGRKTKKTTTDDQKVKKTTADGQSVKKASAGGQQIKKRSSGNQKTKKAMAADRRIKKRTTGSKPARSKKTSAGNKLGRQLLTGTLIIVAMVMVISIVGLVRGGSVKKEDTETANSVTGVIASDEVLHLSFPQLVVDEAYDTAKENIEAEEAEKAAEEAEANGDEDYEEESSDSTETSTKDTNSGNATLTVSDFNDILQQLYDDNYVLVDFYSVVEEGENGFAHAEITVPEGKKPLVISQRNVSYSEEDAQAGHASSLVYANGSFSNTYVMPDELDDDLIVNPDGVTTSEDENSDTNDEDSTSDTSETDVSSDDSSDSSDESYDTDSSDEESYDEESYDEDSYDTEEYSEDEDADLMVEKKANQVAELANCTLTVNGKKVSNAQTILVTDSDYYSDESDSDNSEDYSDESDSDDSEDESVESQGDSSSSNDSSDSSSDSTSGSTSADTSESSDDSSTTANATLTGNMDVITCLDAFIAQHPDFSFNGARGVLALTGKNGVLGYGEDQTEEAKATADALKAEGWRFASYSYAGVSYGSELAIVQSDSDEWEDQVESVVGETDILLLPGKSDIGPWSGYTQSNERFQYLKEKGFKYFCINNNETLFYMQAGSDYARLGMHELNTKNEFAEIMNKVKSSSTTAGSNAGNSSTGSTANNNSSSNNNSSNNSSNTGNNSNANNSSTYNSGSTNNSSDDAEDSSDSYDSDSSYDSEDESTDADTTGIRAERKQTDTVMVKEFII